jgi:hypothetical protein
VHEELSHIEGLRRVSTPLEVDPTKSSESAGHSVEGLQHCNELFEAGAVKKPSVAWAAGVEDAVKDRLQARNFNSLSVWKM